MNRSVMRLLLLTLSTMVATAQGVQNQDIFILSGPLHFKSQAIAGSNAITNASYGFSESVGYGYQIIRRSAASLWVEYANTFGLHSLTTASIPGLIDNNIETYTLGVRIMVPVDERVSFYGVTGGGGGSFHYPVVTGGTVKSNSTTHGVFDFGGGVDFRLRQYFSIRCEVRDFVTGTGLSGAAGRNHVVPSVGIAWHF